MIIHRSIPTMAAAPLRPLELLAQHYDDQSVMLLEQPTPLGYESYIILETTYGLQLAVYETSPHYGDIAFLDGKHEQVDFTKQCCWPSSTKRPFYPEWMIWHDDGCHRSSDDPYVGGDIVRSQHPALEPYLLSWEVFFNAAAKRQEKQVGFVWETVPDVRMRVAWEMKGFLLACWLVLQGAGPISYESHGVARYEIQPNGMDLILRRFLRDMDALIVYKDAVGWIDDEEIEKGCSVC